MITGNENENDGEPSRLPNLSGQLKNSGKPRNCQLKHCAELKNSGEPSNC
jgi:hypothetical protein